MGYPSFLSKSTGQTKNFAKNLAKTLKAGDCLAIYGPLGAGKTTFIQGLAAGLSFSGRVFSPTFVFVRPYKVSDQGTGNREQRLEIKTIYHIDLYRVEKPIDLKTVGISEFLADKQAISVIEWPEKIEKALPERTIRVKIEPVSKNRREIKVSG